jgi:hypothetical protein
MGPDFFTGVDIPRLQFTDMVRTFPNAARNARRAGEVLARAVFGCCPCHGGAVVFVRRYVQQLGFGTVGGRSPVFTA